MDIPTTLILITILILAAAFIVQPFAAPKRKGQEQRAEGHLASALRRRADLLAGRNRVYRALRDLDFDHQTNKIADAEYVTQRCALVAEGVGILQQLDELPASGEPPEADSIEAAVLAFRQGGAVSASSDQGLFCPECGTRAKTGDVFCGRCGTKLGTQE